MDDEIRNIVDFPKRVRYTMLPNQIFDPKYKNNPQKIMRNWLNYKHTNG